MWLLRNWENITGSRYQLWENLLNRVWVTGLFNLQPASGAVSVGHARQGCQSQEQGHLESYFQHKSTLYLQPPLHLQSQGCLQLRCTLDLEFNMSSHTHTCKISLQWYALVCNRQQAHALNSSQQCSGTDPRAGVHLYPCNPIRFSYLYFLIWIFLQLFLTHVDFVFFPP